MLSLHVAGFYERSVVFSIHGDSDFRLFLSTHNLTVPGSLNVFPHLVVVVVMFGKCGVRPCCQMPTSVHVPGIRLCGTVAKQGVNTGCRKRT